MKKIALLILTVVLAQGAMGQVDIESRRTLILQTSFPLRGEEQPNAFGYFWFNENNYPWTNTALRVIFAGIFGDTELSYFLPANTNIAIGAGLGGGLYIDSITPYRDGERLAKEQFYGDVVTGRVFVNNTIPNPTPLPLNLRATYGVTGSFFRKTDTTANFTIPNDFYTQSLTAEFRFGGIEFPGCGCRGPRHGHSFKQRDGGDDDWRRLGVDGARHRERSYVRAGKRIRKRRKSSGRAQHQVDGGGWHPGSSRSHFGHGYAGGVGQLGRRLGRVQNSERSFASQYFEPESSFGAGWNAGNDCGVKLRTFAGIKHGDVWRRFRWNRGQLERNKHRCNGAIWNDDGERSGHRERSRQ